jgi:hypothetical protein
VDVLPVVVGSGWTSGLSAYGTVLVLGLLGRLGIGDVPELLTRGEILAGAGVLFAIEFVVDKIPYLDHGWDAVHTIVRPLIAGFVGAEFAGESDSLSEAVAATSAGGTALLSHAVKASLRLAVNMSPEPFSTIAVSSLEDLLMAGVSYLVATHPLVAFAIAIVLLAAGVALVLAIRRRIARFLERVRVRR